jgi:hypothetical protein
MQPYLSRISSSRLACSMTLGGEHVRLPSVFHARCKNESARAKVRDEKQDANCRDAGRALLTDTVRAQRLAPIEASPRAIGRAGALRNNRDDMHARALSARRRQSPR